MTLYIDVEKKRLVQSPTSDRTVSNPVFMRGDNEPLEIRLVKSGEEIALAESDALRVAIGKFESGRENLTYSEEWILSEAGGAEMALPLNTVLIEEALGNTQSISAYLEVEWTNGGNVITVLQTACTLKNDLIDNIPAIEQVTRFEAYKNACESAASAVVEEKGLVQIMRDAVQGWYSQIQMWLTAIEGYFANMRRITSFPIRGTNGIYCSNYSSQGVQIFLPPVFDTSMGGNSIGYGFIIERDHSFEVIYAGIRMTFTKGANAYSMNLYVRQGDYAEQYAVLYTEENISVDFFNAIQAYWEGLTLTIKTSSGQIITREVGMCSTYLDATEAYYSSSEFYSIFDFVVFGRALDTEWGLGYSPDSFLFGSPDEVAVRHLFKNFPHTAVIIPEGGGTVLAITDYFGPQVENIGVLGTEVGYNPVLQFVGKEPVGFGSTTYAWAGTADAKQVCVANYYGGCLKVDLKFNWRAAAISLQVGYGNMVIDTII